MATRPNQRATSPVAASLILALHARYEQAGMEYDTVDQVHPPEPENHSAEHSADFRACYDCERGMKDNARESELLRQALCWQVPTTDEELTVLAYHAWLYSDAHEMLNEHEREALEQASASIFNYLVSEGRGDMEKLGKRFSSDAQIAFRRCNFRTGQVEA